jgi:uncharacterized protein (TIGR00255 family)
VSISSMTGFARIERAQDGFLWSWELKGVNARNLDVRCRLPAGYESLEGFVRTTTADRLKRGNVAVTLYVNERQARQVIRINENALSQIERLIDHVRGRIDAERPRLDGLLALKGVLEIEEAPPDEELNAKRLAAIRESFTEALDAFTRMRLEEGGALAAIITRQLAEVERLRASATTLAEAQPIAVRDRLQRKLAELLAPAMSLGEDRLAQEVALLAQRADVREELDRLGAHFTAAAS